MRVLVTGVAGFIGSHLADRLVRDGHDVRGVDCFTDYYDTRRKRRNVTHLLAGPRFELLELDLVEHPVVAAVRGADVVFHLAGQPGVRGSWAHGFQPYVDANIIATQRVLEAAKACGTPRVVYASSSSVYGNAVRYPCSEQDVPRPFSPYGVTKLAGEHLARLYASNHGMSTVCLRYFTVFGPRQRPEMGMAQVIEAALTGVPLSLFAAPGSVRDFTYVEDVVAATAAAGLLPELVPGTVVNVAGGTPTSMQTVLELVEDQLGAPVPVRVQPVCAGDVTSTGGDSALARDLLGWQPRVSLEQGLRAQVAWAVAEHAAGRPGPEVIRLDPPETGHQDESMHQDTAGELASA